MRRQSRLLAALCLAAAVVGCSGPTWAADREPENAAKALDALSFKAQGRAFRFDTGELQGTLRREGKSLGLAPVIDSQSGATLTGIFGMLSHYRLLDSESRYGAAAWDWPSEARLLPDGSVATVWSADAGHPLDMKALYRWTSPNALDLVTTVTPRKDLERFEFFLASYCTGFAESLVYVKGCKETGGKPGLVSATKAKGLWQMFPRDELALKIIHDGRWNRPPNPLDWKIMPLLAGPLAIRRDAQTGLTVLVMAPAEDCFAVATPYNEDPHRSLYLSLLGRDLKAGQTATVRSRLVIGRNISNEQAIAIYEAYVKEVRRVSGG